MLAAAGVSLPGCFASRAGRDSRLSIVIVGGGFAGLACAGELLAAGHEVTVLESRGRVGGRVLTFHDLVPGGMVEGGGELIGSNHPHWMHYAHRFGLTMRDVSEYEDLASPIYLEGQLLSTSDAAALWEEMDAAFTSMTADAAPVDADAPWETPGAHILDQRSTEQWLVAQSLSPRASRAIRAELCANNGVATTCQSYLGNLSQIKGGGLEKYWSDSEVFRCGEGNDALASALAGALPRECLRLRSPVRYISRGRNGATVSTPHAEFYCDEVVLAVPPSVWPRIRFDPGLPAELLPQTGQNVKYLAAARRRFWLDSKSAPTSLTDTDVSMTWDATDAQDNIEGACLTAFSGGPAAQACREQSADARAQTYARVLEALYPGFGAAVSTARFMDWPSDPSTGCGYSFPAPGQVTTVGPLLRRGLRGLHFVGEHCCYQFVGYMEGALHSGVATARAILGGDAAPTHGVTRPGPAGILAS